MSVNRVHSDGTLERVAGLGVPGPQGPKGDPGSGSVVEVTQVLSSGTKIAEIDVDGDVTELFAPTGGSGSGDMLTSVYDPDGDVAEAGGIAEYVEVHGGGSDVTVTPALLSGTKIAEISVDGNSTDLFAPNGGAASDPEDFVYIAHRGLYDNTDILQNTAEAFLNAINGGFKYGEVDIRLSKDLIPILMHDTKMEMYDPDTGASVGKKNADAYTVTELKQWVVKAGTNIRMTLDLYSIVKSKMRY